MDDDDVDLLEIDESAGCSHLPSQSMSGPNSNQNSSQRGAGKLLFNLSSSQRGNSSAMNSPYSQRRRDDDDLPSSGLNFAQKVISPQQVHFAQSQSSQREVPGPRTQHQRGFSGEAVRNDFPGGGAVRNNFTGHYPASKAPSSIPSSKCSVQSDNVLWQRDQDARSFSGSREGRDADNSSHIDEVQRRGTQFVTHDDNSIPVPSNMTQMARRIPGPAGVIVDAPSMHTSFTSGGRPKPHDDTLKLPLRRPVSLTIANDPDFRSLSWKAMLAELDLEPYHGESEISTLATFFIKTSATGRGKAGLSSDSPFVQYSILRVLREAFRTPVLTHMGTEYQTASHNFFF